MLARFNTFAATMINADHRRVGGIHFIKIGRFCFTFCISAGYRPIA